MLGQVYKTSTNSYVVKTDDGLVKINAKGLIKHYKEDILVGDFVVVEDDRIVKIKERKNRFIRPSVANVDMIVLLISPVPKPDYFLIDKILVNAIKEGVEVIFAVNKVDTDDKIYYDIYNEYSRLGIKILKLSSKTGEGVKELKEELDNKFVVFAGQSAVGKTSLVNNIFGLNLKIGDVSAIGRGRHTTTRLEVYENDSIKVVDSPGFAVIDADVSADDLSQYYQEYFELTQLCKFRGCKHINEPSCKVKELVEAGVLSYSRYQRYVQIYKELSLRRKDYE